MAGNDNTFERQMIDYYGKNIDNHLFSYYKEKLESDDNEMFRIAFSLLTFQLAIKEKGYMFFAVQDEVKKLQVELYSQLEKDRNNNGK